MPASTRWWATRSSARHCWESPTRSVRWCDCQPDNRVAMGAPRLASSYRIVCWHETTRVSHTTPGLRLRQPIEGFLATFIDMRSQTALSEMAGELQAHE